MARYLIPSDAPQFIASTASRLFNESEGIDPQVPADGNGRCVNVRHFACVASITQIASLHTMQAPESSLNFGFRSNPRACYKAIEMEVIDRQADEDHQGFPDVFLDA
jgi:hypothetical protein